MMPPPSAGPDTSWPTSSRHGHAADTDRLSCRDVAVVVRCGTAPGASLHRSRLLRARWRRAPRPQPHRRGIPPSAAELARTHVYPATHPGFQKTPQRGELLRQPPAGQRRSLVQRIDLLLDQRQVVQRLEYEVLALVGARMTCDHLRAA